MFLLYCTPGKSTIEFVGVKLNTQIKKPVKSQPEGGLSLGLPSAPDFDMQSRRGIGWRLLVQILLFSSLITLTLTLIQLYIDYRREVSTIEQRFEDIQHGYLESLSNSLWNLDRMLLHSQLEWIVR